VRRLVEEECARVDVRSARYVPYPPIAERVCAAFPIAARPNVEDLGVAPLYAGAHVGEPDNQVLVRASDELRPLRRRFFARGNRASFSSPSSPASVENASLRAAVVGKHPAKTRRGS